MKLIFFGLIFKMSGGLFDFSNAIESVEQQSMIIDDDVNDESFNPTDITTTSNFENYEVDFCFNDEGYTLVNILKNHLVDMEEVIFVGRRQHHPLSKKTNLKITLDRDWVDREYKSSVDQAMVDILRRAIRNAIHTTVELRNSIPDVKPRNVDLELNTNSRSDANEVVDNPFQTLFSADDFKF